MPMVLGTYNSIMHSNWTVGFNVGSSLEFTSKGHSLICAPSQALSRVDQHDGTIKLADRC